jgi:hypothetical protein
MVKDEGGELDYCPWPRRSMRGNKVLRIQSRNLILHDQVFDTGWKVNPQAFEARLEPIWDVRWADILA